MGQELELFSVPSPHPQFLVLRACLLATVIEAPVEEAVPPDVLKLQETIKIQCFKRGRKSPINFNNGSAKLDQIFTLVLNDTLRYWDCHQWSWPCLACMFFLPLFWHHKFLMEMDGWRQYKKVLLKITNTLQKRESTSLEIIGIWLKVTMDRYWLKMQVFVMLEDWLGTYPFPPPLYWKFQYLNPFYENLSFWDPLPPQNLMTFYGLGINVFHTDPGRCDSLVIGVLHCRTSWLGPNDITSYSAL